jgi:hypothetical protein
MQHAYADLNEGQFPKPKGFAVGKPPLLANVAGP